MIPESQVDALCAQSAERMAALRAELGALGSAVVAFSGGVDSTLVLKLAVDALGSRAVALTALSASVAPEEVEEARELTTLLGVRHVFMDSHELSDPRYAANPVNRCYFCKSELYEICARARTELGVAAVLDGFNADDFSDHRPGQQAAVEHQIVSPLARHALTKREVRAWSKRLGLPTWDKPQLACLASRLPYGTPVTAERLNQVGRAETSLRALGLKIFRVRYHGEVARLEVAADEQPRLYDSDFRRAVDLAVKGAGFTFVAVDLEPFRTGRLNDALRKSSLSLPVWR